MARIRQRAADALLEQSRAILDGLADLSTEHFDRPSVLPGWDVRELVGHLVIIHSGLVETLARPSRDKPVSLVEYVRGYRPNAEVVLGRARETAGDTSGSELVAELGGLVATLTAALEPQQTPPSVVVAPRGPSTLEDFLASRIVEVVVHADDLNRSLSESGVEPVLLCRGAVARCSRTLAGILAVQHPGRSVEVRIPPYAAVQCGIGDPGPTHTRGTPPNVVETDAVTFFRLATGRTTWSEAMTTGRVHASGLRADLAGVLPLL